MREFGDFFPLDISNTLAVLSALAVASNLPSGLKAIPHRRCHSAYGQYPTIRHRQHVYSPLSIPFPHLMQVTFRSG